ncbi:Crp/Fnr family transcriptional regulator [Erythrobacter sp. THAF29]|uniref:Crp/Fnr family transcriptional regulator n=1 Tax=Erythrobacter sp. THAF29 TaxID=2587851 RepID=UPI0012686141|nr:cyclic nucleotide-binding domain-containing protein [Erythrobacter sp. THAF29]QFT75931.1 Cyclic nucleotide-binding domain protein [Erythrobacter sp. THAF29]
MFEFDPKWLIHIGAGLLLIAYAVRDELRLRILIIAATFIYIAYYYYVPEPPLWDAIVTSVLMVVVNIWVLGEILLERTTLRMTDDEKALFDAFETLSPGQFRRIAKIAKWHRADNPEGTLLIREDEPSDALFYIFDGLVSVEKYGRQFRLPEGNFVGEVAYVLNRKTTTTAVAPKGVRYVEWDAGVLRRLSHRYPALGNALNALLTRDLAKKLKTSYQPDDALPPTKQTAELLEAVD